MSFNNFNFSEPILKALLDHGYTKPTPIQEQAIPVILQNKDLLGCAQTGTGKTAAFALPILEKLQHLPPQQGIKALILAPTRELAAQIGDSITAYSKHIRVSHSVIYGGVSQHTQVQKIRRGVDIVVATPGRLLDLMEQGIFNLNKLQILVLDEADRMLDMGFINDIRKIIKKTPATRQTLLFSATMPDAIKQLTVSILKNPVQVSVTPVSSVSTAIDQSVYFVDKNNKKALLQHVISEKAMRNVLVFTKTKHGADKVAVALNKSGIKSEAIHGNKSQNARQRALDNFKNNSTKVLVATDIAARGIDVTDLHYVINFELPNVPETYVHRIGRTGRAGALGSALSFCDSEERAYLKDINRIVKKDITVVLDHPYADIAPVQYNNSSARPKQSHSHHRNSNSSAGKSNNRRRFAQYNKA
jgi:ATP-dependent RNA helicase RhlE